MKTILCYGDSNTYGYDPVSGGRFDHNIRWPGVLRNDLGDGWWVIEEGCGGRTTVWEDPIERHKDGSAYLPACLHSHGPLDLIVIMLGTNDLKQARRDSPGGGGAREAGEGGGEEGAGDFQLLIFEFRLEFKSEIENHGRIAARDALTYSGTIPSSTYRRQTCSGRCLPSRTKPRQRGEPQWQAISKSSSSIVVE